MGFEQAAIKVEKEKEFEELKGAIDRAFRPESIQGLLKELNRQGLRIRDFDAVLAGKVLEKKDVLLGPAGRKAQDLYEVLPVSDRSQIRELYLSRVEDVDPKLRTKFQKLFRYY